LVLAHNFFFLAVTNLLNIPDFEISCCLSHIALMEMEIPFGLRWFISEYFKRIVMGSRTEPSQMVTGIALQKSNCLFLTIDQQISHQDLYD